MFLSTTFSKCCGLVLKSRTVLLNLLQLFSVSVHPKYCGISESENMHIVPVLLTLYIQNKTYGKCVCAFSHPVTKEACACVCSLDVSDEGDVLYLGKNEQQQTLQSYRGHLKHTQQKYSIV